jgi:hypothetical protein
MGAQAETARSGAGLRLRGRLVGGRSVVGSEAALGLLRALAVLLLLAAFYRPAIERMGRLVFPAPLDDVYIYFDFARSTAEGCLLCWTPETGYSSGATSPPYALALAVFHLIGFSGDGLGLAAAVLAFVSLWDLTGSLARMAGGGPRAALLATALVLGIPLLDWTWVSGMEAAFAAAIFARAVVATQRARAALASGRPRAQLHAGVWLALSAWARPECAPAALILATTVAHAAGELSAAAALARAGGPTAATLALSAIVNRWLTGEASPAGAVRKLVTSDPYSTPVDKTIVVLKNLVRLVTEGLEGGLGGPRALVALLALGLASVVHRATRALGLALLGGACASLALVCLNTTAPYQNLRYLGPTLLMLVAAALLGLRALELRGRMAGIAGSIVVIGVVVSASREFARQIGHFSRAAANIAEQQLEVGRRLGALAPRPARVFVGDAGAIPYASGLPALDGLGLGGDHDLPFARASVHGVPAVIELIERLPSNARPDVLAIYDGWWSGLPARFGEPMFSVRIEDNVICADPVKSVYRANWALLEDRTRPEGDVLDVLDFGDLIDERSHSMTFSRPRNGYVVDAVLRDGAGRMRWDAGRSIEKNHELSFELSVAEPMVRARLVLRSDTATPTGSVVHRGQAHSLEARTDVSAPSGPSWREHETTLVDVEPGDRVVVQAGREPARWFAMRLERVR